MSSRKKLLFHKIIETSADKSYKSVMKPTIAIASDHGGYNLKEFIKDSFKIKWIDIGTHNDKKSVDYPDYGHALAAEVAAGNADFGIAICGTGIGISIACNRNLQVRAALCTNATMARLTREHNDANVLCLGERITGTEAALDIVKTFLETEFDGGRHTKRIAKLDV